MIPTTEPANQYAASHVKDGPPRLAVVKFKWLLARLKLFKKSVRNIDARQDRKETINVNIKFTPVSLF